MNCHDACSPEVFDSSGADSVHEVRPQTPLATICDVGLKEHLQLGVRDPGLCHEFRAEEIDTRRRWYPQTDFGEDSMGGSMLIGL